MVLGVISLAATVPLIASSTLSLQDSAQQQQVSSEEAALKTEKCSIRLRASARMSDERKRIVADRQLTLVGRKLYMMADDSEPFHRFAGYFLEYPDQGYDGLVSTINSENMLNWLYVDTETYEIRYGVREEAEKNLPGPMGLTTRTALSEIGEAGKEKEAPTVERRYIFDGWEGFALVEEKNDVWALYFDKDDDGLKGKVRGKRVTEVELCRVPLIE